jgi:hypothetical protein
MKRHDVLKKILQGQEISSEDIRWESWARTYKPLLSPSAFSMTGRHLNHFCLGSDPEFSLIYQGDRMEAVSAGLKVGLVAGADQNERLVELRPWQSVSAVEHVAGILTALRWLHRVYGRYAAACAWRSGGFYSGDGMGGHVHFGRKRPTRDVEISALDGLARVFRSARLFDGREWDKRIQGDAIGQHYGMPGDFRLQRHGYEYRSLPSWLQTPEVAFIVLCCSKLAVLDPSVTLNWKDTNLVDAYSKLRGLAKLYKGRDDDAYILYHNLTRRGDDCFLVNFAADFAAAWGITHIPVESGRNADIILPASIKPTKETIEEMQNHLLMQFPLNFREEPANFVTNLPHDYFWEASVTVPNRRSGFGDLLHNLVAHQLFPVKFMYDNHATQLQIYGEMVSCMSPAEIDLLRSYDPRMLINPKGDTPTIVVSKPFCQTATIAGLRAILLHSGIFPLWTVESVTADSIKQWCIQHPKQAKREKWRQL